MSSIKDWVNTGTNATIFLRKIIVIGVSLLIIYKLGYAVGKFVAYIGF